MKNALSVLFVVLLIVYPALADEKPKADNAKFVVPALRTVDMAGKEFDLSKLKGKVILVDFWATWCPPCLKEIPKLQKMHNAMHGKGFEIVGVANNSKDDLAEFFESNSKVPWATIADADNSVSSDFNVQKWPTTILIDRKGKLLGKDLPAEDIVNKILEELNLKPEQSKKVRDALKDLGEKHTEDEQAH